MGRIMGALPYGAALLSSLFACSNSTGGVGGLAGNEGISTGDSGLSWGDSLPGDVLIGDSLAGGDSLTGGDSLASGGDLMQGDTGAIVDCFTCHGIRGASNNAPPLDIAGTTDIDLQGVGAHQSHLRSSDWHSEIRCEHCHTVPTDSEDPGHRDDTRPADLLFTGLALADGANPDYLADNGCGNVYCHGSTLRAGGSRQIPVWTVGGGVFDACGSCHDIGINPREMSGKHDSHILQHGIRCDECHPPQNPDGSFADPALHIDGLLQFVNPNVTFDRGHCVGLCHPANDKSNHKNRMWRPL